MTKDEIARSYYREYGVLQHMLAHQRNKDCVWEWFREPDCGNVEDAKVMAEKLEKRFGGDWEVQGGDLDWVIISNR